MLTKIESSKAGKHLGSLLILSTLMAIVSQFFIAAPAKSQQCPVCQYNGACYEEGETAGPFICRADGNWQRND